MYDKRDRADQSPTGKTARIGSQENTTSQAGTSINESVTTKQSKMGACYSHCATSALAEKPQYQRPKEGGEKEKKKKSETSEKRERRERVPGLLVKRTRVVGKR
jgi:hypothetical protein